MSRRLSFETIGDVSYPVSSMQPHPMTLLPMVMAPHLQSAPTSFQRVSSLIWSLRLEGMIRWVVIYSHVVVGKSYSDV